METLKVEIFADGADIESMVEISSKPYIAGLTTNPTLMRKAGITDYLKFAKDVLKEISDKPISFEVFSDDLEEMKTQGQKISSWGQNANVKIPITNTKGVSTKPVIEHLSSKGIVVNVTALMCPDQVSQVAGALNPEVPSYISVFAGRIADTGRDPMPIIRESVQLIKSNSLAKLIWASPRELLNVFQANEVGCHVITATNDILKKLSLINKDLNEYSLETVRMFYNDAKMSKFEI